MDTGKLIDESIKRWELIKRKKLVDKSIEEDPLCREFYTDDAGCPGCPVSEKTGESYCDKTPVHEWNAHQDAAHEDKFPFENRCLRCSAILERVIQFLKDVRKTV